MAQSEGRGLQTRWPHTPGLRAGDNTCLLLKPLGLGSLSQRPQEGERPGLHLARFCPLEVHTWSPGLGRRRDRLGGSAYVCTGGGWLWWWVSPMPR